MARAVATTVVTKNDKMRRRRLKRTVRKSRRENSPSPAWREDAGDGVGSSPLLAMLVEGGESQIDRYRNVVPEELLHEEVDVGDAGAGDEHDVGGCESDVTLELRMLEDSAQVDA